MPAAARVPLIIVCALLAACACDRRPAGRAGRQTTPAQSPQTAPVAAPAASRPSSSTLLIAGREERFPPARVVVLREQPDCVDLLLISDDPRDALHPSYRGNRYYLPLRLENSTLATLSRAERRMRAPSMERRDIPDGIFLDGNRKQLQPYDVYVCVNRDDDELVIMIEGQFTLFSNDQMMAQPHLVPVEGALRAAIDAPAGRSSRDSAGR